MGQIYNKDRWNEFAPVRPLFNKGDGFRVTYTVNSKFYKYLTSLGVKSYDTLGGKPAPHEGDDVIAIDKNNNKLPRGSYQVLMPFDSMECTEVTGNVTGTIAFVGYTTTGSKVDLRIAHCINPVVKVGEVYYADDVLATESSKGLKNPNDDHVHFTLKVDGKIKSLVAMLSLVEPFPTVTHNGKEEENMDIQKGIQTITYKGKQFAILYQPDDYEPYLLSLKHPVLYPLSLINVKEWDIYGKKNASVFEMKQNANYGYVYGSEVSDIYDEVVPTSQGLIDVVKLKDGTWKFGNFGYDKYRKDEVILRYSTYMVLVAGGVYSNERSKFDISTTNTKMSCLFVNWSNEALFVVSIDNASLDEMRSLAMELGMQYAFVDDSGGSASIVAKGKVYSGNSSERATPNCLAFVKSTDLPHNEKPIEPPIQPPLEDDKDKRIAELEKENQELTKKIENAKIALG